MNFSLIYFFSSYFSFVLILNCWDYSRKFLFIQLPTHSNRAWHNYMWCIQTRRRIISSNYSPKPIFVCNIHVENRKYFISLNVHCNVNLPLSGISYSSSIYYVLVCDSKYIQIYIYISIFLVIQRINLLDWKINFFLAALEFLF